MEDEWTPQERMANVHAVYGSRYSKSITTRRTMVRNLQKIGSRPLSLHDDEEILDNPKEFILHLLQVSGPR
jgi:hypothetical protein